MKKHLLILVCIVTFQYSDCQVINLIDTSFFNRNVEIGIKSKTINEEEFIISSSINGVERELDTISTLGFNGYGIEDFDNDSNYDLIIHYIVNIPIHNF